MIEFSAISKSFAGVRALDGVSFSIARGECHGLMGENGAGKSTLGKVLAGIHRADAGTMQIDGHAVRFGSPRDALRAGVGMVHQELAFCPELSVAENLCMGTYPRRAGMLIDTRVMRERAMAALGRIGVEIDVDRPMSSLTTAQEQLVQIASAVATGARILVFDEPTSSLSEPEAQRLFALIEDLRTRGTTIVYVSHRMPEVSRLCDRVTVLRDGKYVGTLEKADASQDAIVRMMIGRSLEAYFPKHLDRPRGPVRLSVRGLSSAGKFRDIGFEVSAGEIVGFAGLVGSGRSEVAQAIFGLDPSARGEVIVDGKPLPIGRVRAARAAGVGLVPEDRKRQGLVLQMSCVDNFSLAMLDRSSRAGFLQHRSVRTMARTWFDRLRVKTSSLDAPVSSLSGGNQQKIALAKWIARECGVLIVDEPTRGVDVGAKAAIHELIDEIAGSGVAVVLISSELPEVINLSTRILVMREGRLAGEIGREHATQESVLWLMSGVGAMGVGSGAS